MKKALVIGIVTVLAFAGGLLGPSLLLPAPAPAEGAGGTATAEEAAIVPSEDSPAGSDSLAALPAAAADSLEALRGRLAEAEAEARAHRERVGTLEQALQEQTDRRARAQELSSTVSRLEDGELRALLSAVDAAVLAELYAEASPRNRTKLLQALPAARGAALVERIAGGAPRAVQQAAPAPPPSAPVVTTSSGGRP